MVLGIIFAVCISLILPIFAFIYAWIKKCYIPFILGGIAFVGSQVFIRIPILQYLQQHSEAYSTFSTNQPILFYIVIGLSAGVFEGLARYIMMRFFMKQRDWQSGFLFGAGHGGIEAVLLVGITAFALLFSPSAHIYNFGLFIGGIERLFAIMLHIGLSIIVLRGVVKRKFIYVVIAMLIHGFVDSLVGIFPLFLSQTTSLLAIEVSAAIIAIAVFSYSFILKRRGVLQ